jgi:hypothetical protein
MAMSIFHERRVKYARIAQLQKLNFTESPCPGHPKRWRYSKCRPFEQWRQTQQQAEDRRYIRQAICWAPTRPSSTTIGTLP